MKRIEGWVDCSVHLSRSILRVRGVHGFENGLEAYSDIIPCI